MATLEKIRNKAGLLIGVVGIALFAFILGDFLNSGSTFFHQSKEKVVVVDGNSISIQDYQSRVEYISSMYDSGNLNEVQQIQIRESIYKEMVNTILLKEEAKKLGLNVGKEELSDLILGNNISPIIQQIPDFQNQQTGMFDKNAFLQFLQMVETDDISMYPVEYQQQILLMKRYWLNLEQNVINDKLNSKLMALVNSGVAYNSLDAKQHFEESSVNVDFSYAIKLLASIPDSDVTVSDSEISKLYEERKESFKQDETKIIDYIAVNIVPSQTDFEEAAAQLEKTKQELEAATSNVGEIVNDNSDRPFTNAFATKNELNTEIANFVQKEPVGAIYGPTLTNNTYTLCKLVDTTLAPDSSYVYLLNMPPFNDAEMLTNFSDSLIKVVKDGKTFAEMALESTGGESNGDVGWQTEYSLLRNGADQSLLDAIFSTKLNEVQLVKSTRGNLLIQVTERTKPVTKYKVANIQLTVTPSTETYNSLYNDLNQYISKNNKASAFRDNASEAGYYVQPDVSLTASQNYLDNITNSRQIVRWAFNNSKGSISDIFECDDYFVAAVVVGATKKGYSPLTGEVSNRLKRELLNKKKGEKFVADLKTQNLSSLEQYAEAMNSSILTTQFVNFSTPRITGIGADPVVNAIAVDSEVGSLTEPFVGNNAVYVLSVTNKNTNDQTYDEAAQKSQLQMQNSYRLGQAIRSGSLLQENAKIEDNRLRFY